MRFVTGLSVFVLTIIKIFTFFFFFCTFELSYRCIAFSVLMLYIYMWIVSSTCHLYPRAFIQSVPKYWHLTFLACLDLPGCKHLAVLITCGTCWARLTYNFTSFLRNSMCHFPLFSKPRSYLTKSNPSIAATCLMQSQGLIYSPNLIF